MTKVRGGVLEGEKLTNVRGGGGGGDGEKMTKVREELEREKMTKG